MATNGFNVTSNSFNPNKKLTCWTGRQQLKPAVQDLSGQLIPQGWKRSTPTDEESYLYIIKSLSNSRHVGEMGISPQALLGDRNHALTCRPVQNLRITSPRSAGFFTCRADTPEELHRRNVQRSARFRSRINYTRSRSADHMMTPAQQSHLLDEPLSLLVKRTGDRGSETFFDLSSGVSSREYIPTSRPATTGRYFNTTNGLRSRAAHQSARPMTAGSWLTSGMKIQRIRLQDKPK